MEIVWSVFGDEEFSMSARLFYRTLRTLNRATRLWGPPVGSFFAQHMWGPQAKLAAQFIKSRFVNGEKCPHSIEDLLRQCLGHPGRKERIYGAYKRTDCGDRAALALPDSCILLLPVVGVSAPPQPSVHEDGDTPALGEDPAVTHRLPEEYYGVLVPRHRGQKILTLTAAFMNSAFEPVASSNPPREQLEKWWLAVSKRIRDSYDHKAIPVDLRAAMKGRARRAVHVRGRRSLGRC